MMYGEQRGAALGDLNSNGRTDLVLSQNAADTKLYLNQAERRGIRIRLEGPQENRAGIGAAIRLLYEDGTHVPKRVIPAGSGYWCRKSATQVLGSGAQHVAIERHGPGGGEPHERV